MADQLKDEYAKAKAQFTRAAEACLRGDPSAAAATSEALIAVQAARSVTKADDSKSEGERG